MSNNSSLYEAPCRGPFYFCVLYFFMAFFSNLDIFCRLFSIPYTTSAPHYSLYLLHYFLYSLCYFSVYLAYYSLFSIVCSIFLYTCPPILYYINPIQTPLKALVNSVSLSKVKRSICLSFLIYFLVRKQIYCVNNNDFRLLCSSCNSPQADRF